MNVIAHIDQLQKVISQQEEIISLQRKLIAKYEGIEKPKKKYDYKTPGFPDLKIALKRCGKELEEIAINHNVSYRYTYQLLNGTRQANSAKAKAIVIDMQKVAELYARVATERKQILKTA